MGNLRMSRGKKGRDSGASEKKKTRNCRRPSKHSFPQGLEKGLAGRRKLAAQPGEKGPTDVQLHPKACCVEGQKRKKRNLAVFKRITE